MLTQTPPTKHPKLTSGSTKVALKGHATLARTPPHATRNPKNGVPSRRRLVRRAVEGALGVAVLAHRLRVEVVRGLPAWRVAGGRGWVGGWEGGRVGWVGWVGFGYLAIESSETQWIMY